MKSIIKNFKESQHCMNKFVRHLKRKVSKILERNCVRDLSKGPETTPNAQENISIRMDYGGSRKDRLLQKEYLPVRLKYPKDNLEKKGYKLESYHLEGCHLVR